MDAVKHSVVALIGVSEDLDSAADTMDPEMAPVEFDDQAMAEAAAEWAEEAAELEYDSDEEVVRPRPV
jgi:hypothetical protein